MLQPDAGYLPIFRQSELLLDCLQRGGLGLLQEQEKLLSARSYCLLCVEGVLSEQLTPRLGIPRHLKGKIEGASSQIGVREAKGLAMKERELYQVTREVEDQRLCLGNFTITFEETIT